MALPFANKTPKGRDQLLSIDLGGRTTKAVHLQRKGEGFALAHYALLDAPIYEKNLSAELLSEHLKNVVQVLDVRLKQVTLAVGVSDSLVRQTEMPLMPVDDMRQLLKMNTRSYLQQELTGYEFDCCIIPSKQLAKAMEKPKGANNVLKSKVLVAGAKKQFLDDLQQAIREAGLVPDYVMPGLIGPVNAFEMAMPEAFAGEVLALVDIGFKNSTICLLHEGELALSRVVNIGGDKLTNGLAEFMNISYAEAEGIKVGMPAEVQPQLESLVSPLGRELRASIDFFEHQQDKAVAKVYLSGGSARSELILQMLQNEMMAECKTWNPTAFLQLTLPPQQASELEHVAPQLTTAIGAALAAA